MRNALFLVPVCLTLLLGCAGKRYAAGRGDAGQFMLSRIVTYGGRTIATNGLPAIPGDWKYIEDKYGVGLMFPASRYGEVESFLTAALGPRSNKPGWAARDVGAAVFLEQNDENTLVGIHPPKLGLK